MTRRHGDVYFDYSIAHLLEDVKGVFTDTFSEDVYDRLGTKREGTDFSENLQYQQRTEILTDREVLEMASNEIAVSDLSKAEKDELRIFRERLSKLKDLQKKRIKRTYHPFDPLFFSYIFIFHSFVILIGKISPFSSRGISSIHIKRALPERMPFW